MRIALEHWMKVWDFCHGCRTAAATLSINKECQDCSLRDYCMRLVRLLEFSCDRPLRHGSHFLALRKRRHSGGYSMSSRELNESMGPWVFQKHSRLAALCQRQCQKSRKAMMRQEMPVISPRPPTLENTRPTCHYRRGVTAMV